MDLPASSSKDTTEEVPKLTEEQSEERDEQHSVDNLVEHEVSVNHKFALPPEYDANDSRWTLKYRGPAPGLIELMEHSGVYVNADKLNESKKISKDCHKLAEILLHEVFTTNALNICSMPAALRNAFRNRVEHGTPEFDSHATTTLLKFVAEYGLEEDWKVEDYDRILTNICAKIETYRKNKFVLPPEYDANDSRWTLKYRGPAPGLIELMEHSSVYINTDQFNRCKKMSKSCLGMAEMLLYEVFTTNALSTCALPAALCNAFNIHVEHGRPALPIHATTTLLNFVAEYGLERDWKVYDYGRILKYIRKRIGVMRMLERKIRNLHVDY